MCRPRLLPQFGSHFAGMALLGLEFCAMTFAWLGVRLATERA